MDRIYVVLARDRSTASGLDAAFSEENTASGYAGSFPAGAFEVLPLNVDAKNSGEVRTLFIASINRSSGSVEYSSTQEMAPRTPWGYSEVSADHVIGASTVSNNVALQIAERTLAAEFHDDPDKRADSTASVEQ